MSSSSSGLFSGSRSPVSPYDKASSNPHIIKPTGIMAQKQRSSSINSITSNHSAMNNNAPNTNNTRSMSIISLESPRNSIVSIDDSMVKTTRNNSTSSLNSLANIPIAPIEYNISHKLSSSKSNSNAVFSDEESDMEPTRSIIKPNFKGRGKHHSGTDILYLKQDFEFKYDDLPMTNSNCMKEMNDNSESPLAKTATDVSESTCTDTKDKSSQSSKAIQSSKKGSNSNLVKKVKPSNLIQQSIYLKKKIIYSKDLHFEFLSNNNHNNTNELIDTKFIRRNNHQANGESFEPLPSDLSQQNKLIYKLNQKWNKSINGKMSESPTKSRKRSRSLSVEYENDNCEFEEN